MLPAIFKQQTYASIGSITFRLRYLPNLPGSIPTSPATFFTDPPE